MTSQSKSPTESIVNLEHLLADRDQLVRITPDCLAEVLRTALEGSSPETRAKVADLLLEGLGLRQSGTGSLVSTDKHEQTVADATTESEGIDSYISSLPSRNSRLAYSRAITRLVRWCEAKGLSLCKLERANAVQYFAEHDGSSATLRQNKSVICGLFDHFITLHLATYNPFLQVRITPESSVRLKTPALTINELSLLFERIDCSDIMGLRDRALMGLIFYAFARVSCALQIRASDLSVKEEGVFLCLPDRKGTRNEYPLHPQAYQYVKEYLSAAAHLLIPESPIFQSVRRGTLSGRGMGPTDVLRMFKRRSAEANLPVEVSADRLVATGIAFFLKEGGTLEEAQFLARHTNPNTTSKYASRKLTRFENRGGRFFGST